jgi:hypothetical protein
MPSYVWGGLLDKTSSYVWGKLLDKRKDILFHGNNEIGAVNCLKDFLGQKKAQSHRISRRTKKKLNSSYLDYTRVLVCPCESFKAFLLNLYPKLAKSCC